MALNKTLISNSPINRDHLHKADNPRILNNLDIHRLDTNNRLYRHPRRRKTS
jgi:hypothetical protein